MIQYCIWFYAIKEKEKYVRATRRRDRMIRGRVRQMQSKWFGLAVVGSGKVMRTGHDVSVIVHNPT